MTSLLSNEKNGTIGIFPSDDWNVIFGNMISKGLCCICGNCNLSMSHSDYTKQGKTLSGGKFGINYFTLESGLNKKFACDFVLPIYSCPCKSRFQR
jgi:hypothetical protein